MQHSLNAADIDDLLPELIALRRDLHAHPELAFEERRTAGIVAAELRRLDLEVHEGLAGTGIVGTLRQGRSKRTIGLRADMDALPITEQSRFAHASRHAGVHHGCGHDGHTAMLLGAARHLARTRRFDGTVNFIFQPAEEGRGGARVMLEQGLFERFPCDAVYALHNWPDLPVGHAQTRPGPIMAAADRFDIVLRGRGGHAAQPHRTPDVLLAASQLVVQLNTIVSRRVDPAESAVLSVTRMAGGVSHNVLPAEAQSPARCAASTSQCKIESRPRCGMPRPASRSRMASTSKSTTSATILRPSTRLPKRRSRCTLPKRQGCGRALRLARR